MSEEAERRLVRIEEAIRMLSTQMEDLFRLLDGRLQNQQDETDQRFQSVASPYTRIE